MGTHPIFESDFDCLTEMIRFIIGLLVASTRAFGPWSMIGADNVDDVDEAFRAITNAQYTKRSLMNYQDAYDPSGYDPIYASLLQKRMGPLTNLGNSKLKFDKSEIMK